MYKPCIDCGQVIEVLRRTKRCPECQSIFRNKKRLYSRNNRCKVCGCLITNKATFCLTHAQPKGKQSPNYTNGYYTNNKTHKQANYKKGRKCQDCGRFITDRAVRCKSCELKRTTKTKLEKQKSRNQHDKQRKQQDITYKLTSRLRSLLSKKIKYKNNSTLQFLGCSVAFLKVYLELQFKPGMTWENYGHDGWHIDHIRPCASFDLLLEEHQRACFRFTNLQPLWEQENLTKGVKYVRR